jgi:phage terminase large subunit GpA-like protein
VSACAPAVDLRLARVRARWAPPPDLRVSEFCDRELVVTTGPLAGTRWQTDLAPYQRGIMDVFSEPGIEYGVCRTSAQVGKTSLAVGVLAYHIAHDPCPILVVEPTVDPMARDFAKNRLDPVIAASPVLNDAVSKKRSKDSANTILAKSFRGGSLSIGGANSAASLAARSIRLLILDEPDRYPPELPGEGSTIQIALKRTAAYRGRRRILLLSTPTLKGAPIDAWFRRGDQRRFYVPCPACSFMHPFEWRNVRWSDGDASTARLHCPSCDHGIDEAERVSILNLGEWRAEAKPSEPNIASFHLWEAYSPFSSLREIVASFLRAREAQKAGDKGEMHTWQNTTLGEPIEPEAGEGVEAHSLLQRIEAYEAQAPAGVCTLTVGVDTQDDRLEALVVGWGQGEESWLIDRQRLAGDTSQPAVWALLDELLARSYQHPSGRRLEILAAAVDSAGHRTTQVYEYVAARRAAARRVFATIGRSGQRPIISAPSPKHWGTKPRPVDLYTIGVDAAKALVMGRLSLPEPGPGYVHIPQAEWADDDLAQQLTSERLMTRYTKGVPVQEWRLVRQGQRNEMLDCYVLSLAALRLSRVDLKLMALRLQKPPAQAPTRPRRPAPGGGLDVPDDWLERRR